MAFLELWNTKEKAQNELQLRLQNSMTSRRNHELQWERNEITVFSKGGPVASMSGVSISFDSDPVPGDSGDANQLGDASIGTNYSLKNLRLIHAQLSANPPTVIPRPTSNDPDDRRRADAADRLIRYALRQYSMQEKADLTSLQTLVYGAGFAKTMWDKDAGDILEVNDETGELTMEGDFSVVIPSTWNIYLDPEATCWEDVRYVFERIIMPYEQACFQYPGKKEILERYRMKNGSIGTNQGVSRPAPDNRYYDSVELYQYWEKGLPVNGFGGRFCVCTVKGELVTELTKNPERYSSPKIKTKGETASKPIEKAVLPFHIFTDLDVPHQVWGKSSIEFSSAMQDNLNRIDSITLENIKAHGVARLILPEGAEIKDDSITNSPWDIIKMTGSMPAHFMEPMPLPPSMSQLRDTMKQGIDDMFGVNEAMFGQQSREQSGFSMQYATNQGNMIRRRLFNKYVFFVEGIYKRFLQIVQKNWDTPRTVHVLGKEKAFEVSDLKGADIEGGYDLVVEYGTSLSLDPLSRRQEIMTLMPLFEKSGMDSRVLVSLMKLDELSEMYDALDLAPDRQREYFEEMLATGMYLPPRELEDHPNMLKFAYTYVMTVEYKYLTDDQKALIDAHIHAREQMEAQKQAAAQGGAPTGTPPGPVPMGPTEAPAPAAGMTGEPTTVQEAPAILPGQ